MRANHVIIKRVSHEGIKSYHNHKREAPSTPSQIVSRHWCLNDVVMVPPWLVSCTVTEVRVAIKAADNEFTRWEVQEREVDENALSIPKSNKSLFKVITILAEGMFGFYAAMNGLADYEKKKCNLGVIVTALVIVFGGIALGSVWLHSICAYCSLHGLLH
nr:hypothetical protein [Tanacetum cinerariifolium]